MPTYSIRICRELEWNYVIDADNERDAIKAALREGRFDDDFTILGESVDVEEQQ